MPTFYAMLAASALSWIVTDTLEKSLGIMGFILASIVWVVAFYLVKKWLTALRP